MNSEITKQIIELVYEHEATSATGRTLLPTRIIKKIAVMLGGNYDDLNKIQKAIFRSDCSSKRVSNWEFYIFL